ncbi:MAG: GreA/GreB family elongation factor [Patescibacteria group bacterium]
MFKFLQEDLDALNVKIDEICGKIRAIGREIRECNERREAVNDNFVHENAPWQEEMWAKQLRSLKEIRDHAEVVSPDPRGLMADVGKVVVFRDVNSGERRKIKIGSFMILNGAKGVVSYNAPLGRLLYGSCAGEVREGEIGGKKKTFRIVSVK